jgi:hypothetical protein
MEFYFLGRFGNNNTWWFVSNFKIVFWKINFLKVEERRTIVEAKVEAKKDVLLTKEDKIDLIEKIHKSKIETIIWIVGVGVIQFILTILSKKIL